MKNLKVDQTCDEESDDLIAYLMQEKEIESVQLNDIYNEISDHLAWYTSYKLENQCKGCCFDRCFDISGSSLRNNEILSQGGLKSPSRLLGDIVRRVFAILQTAIDGIHRSSIPAKRAELIVLWKFLPRNELFLKIHEQLHLKVMSVITNVYFNNKRKRSTESVIENKVIPFKNMKRKK